MSIYLHYVENEGGKLCGFLPLPFRGLMWCEKNTFNCQVFLALFCCQGKGSRREWGTWDIGFSLLSILKKLNQNKTQSPALILDAICWKRNKVLQDSRDFLMNFNFSNFNPTSFNKAVSKSWSLSCQNVPMGAAGSIKAAACEGGWGQCHRSCGIITWCSFLFDCLPGFVFLWVQLNLILFSQNMRVTVDTRSFSDPAEIMQPAWKMAILKILKPTTTKHFLSIPLVF